MKGKNIKDLFTEHSSENYKALKFKDLKVGDKYISLPIPGDNEGHGGFKGTHWIFEKVLYINKEYNSLRLSDSELINAPKNLLVIKVE